MSIEQVTLQLDMATIGQHYTRGNSRKLTVMRCRFDLRKYSFTGHPKSRRNDGMMELPTEQQSANGQTTNGTAKKLDRTTKWQTEQQ